MAAVAAGFRKDRRSATEEAGGGRVRGAEFQDESFLLGVLGPRAGDLLARSALGEHGVAREATAVAQVQADVLERAGAGPLRLPDPLGSTRGAAQQRQDRGKERTEATCVTNDHGPRPEAVRRDLNASAQTGPAR